MGSSNYLAWDSSIELWCRGQGVQNHLTTNACVVDEKAKVGEEDAKAKPQWEKVDALIACEKHKRKILLNCVSTLLH